jgi:hypothetical protein
MHNPSRVLMTEMSWDGKLRAIEVFLSTPPTGDAEALAWFKAWVRKADRLRQRRNDVVHSQWAVDGNDPGDTAMAVDDGSRRARLGLRLDHIPGRKADVGKLADEIMQHRKDLSTWEAAQFRRLWPPAAESNEHIPAEHPMVTRLTITSDPSGPASQPVSDSQS